MSIFVKNGVLHVSGAEDKLRHKGEEHPAFLNDYTLLDIETTGLRTYRDRVTELGAIKVHKGKVVDQYSHLVAYPGSNRVPAFITRLNGITAVKIKQNGIPVARAIHDFRSFIGDDVIVGYNVNFDLNFIYDLAKKYHQPELTNNYVDVLRLARFAYPEWRHHRLLDCMQQMGIAQVEQHRGLDDSIATKTVYDHLRQKFTPALLKKAQKEIKNIDLTRTRVDGKWRRRDPVWTKKIVLTGHLHMDQAQGQEMIKNMGGQLQRQVQSSTNYLIMGDHDFFSHQNPELNRARALIKKGQKISRLSESFFLNMLDSWARS